MSKPEPAWYDLVIFGVLLISGAALIVSASAYILWSLSWPMCGILGGLALLLSAVIYNKLSNWLKEQP